MGIDRVEVASDDGIKFLGVEIGSRHTRIQAKKLKGLKLKLKLKLKVEQLTRRNGGRNLESVISKLNPVIRGFAYDFSIANCKTQFKSLSEWIDED